MRKAGLPLPYAVVDHAGNGLFGPSLRSRAVVALARTLIRPLLGVLPLNATVMRCASLLDRGAALMPLSKESSFERVTLAYCEAEIVRADDEATIADGALLYLHGGGFIAGGLNTHRRMITVLAQLTGLPVMHVAYRKLPGATIRESVADCVKAYEWLLQHGAHPKHVVVAGESVGGFLAFAAVIAARDQGMPAPGGLAAISPWLDLDCAAKSAEARAQTEALLPIAMFETVSRLGAEVDGVLDSTLSPALADVRGLPPTLLVALRSEVLRPDAEAMAARLGGAGVPCVLHLWRGQIHAFSALFPGSTEGWEVLSDLSEFVRARVAAQPAQPHAG
ncbi:alpha/beta hydrolase [Hoyosella subflava]|uniref:Putative esterase/ lipase n=1 Tax=Hoyosella subflava (strain DSM 45089 / JCM 17490 / NBRC 109087 / DQS3-9A1) TaxID=443218 RepID=F6EL91_HOYSD|nr:alpha/beta hydrolase [Hoyosella subflava]AEF39183.1 putative esterase/ lipase [Hoyosella subflava DQS3-9A1]